jgi:nicotinate phosphoribosyltransferase
MRRVYQKINQRGAKKMNYAADFLKRKLDLERNATLHADWYLFKMQFGFWSKGLKDTQVATDLITRKIPFENGYTVYAGLESAIEYILQLHVTEGDIAYLKTYLPSAPEAYWDDLRAMKFTGDLSSLREGEIFFPKEPIIHIKARVFEAVIVETALLNLVNHETLICTKASRVMNVVGDRKAIDGGTRRAHGFDAGVFGTRACRIAGFAGTSLVVAGKMFGIPLFGSMAHFWVQFFETELEAFMAWAEIFPDDCILLIDTYDVIKSGVPNAIIVATYLESIGQRLKSVRIDSGDLAYLWKKTRKMLDDAGFTYVKITASGDLDEDIADELVRQGANYDAYLFGTKIITAYDQPTLGAVYKLIAVTRGEGWEAVIKISENAIKIPEPGFKVPYRIVDNVTGKAKGDYLAKKGEDVLSLNEIVLRDPQNPELNFKTVTDFTVIPILTPIFESGELVYNPPTLDEIAVFHQEAKAILWEEFLRKTNPERYPVAISDLITADKLRLIKKHRN